METGRGEKTERKVHKDLHSNGWLYAFIPSTKSFVMRARLSNNCVFCCDEGNTLKETVTRVQCAQLHNQIDYRMFFELYRTCDPCTMLFLAFVAAKLDVRGE